MTHPVGMTSAQRRFLHDARRAVLATVDPTGRPRLVPVCHVLADHDAVAAATAAPVVWTPIDDKPKANADPRALARVRDILARPSVALLVDRWDEDWSRLAWLRLLGTASLVEPGAGEHQRAVAALRRKYAQYAGHRLEALPVISVTIERVVEWGALDELR